MSTQRLRFGHLPILAGIFNGIGSRKRTIKRHSPTPLFSLTDPATLII